MIGTHCIIESDLYHIVQRLKEIEPTYFVALNYKTGRFELHAQNRRGGTLALTLPFESLDERTVRFVRQTRSERLKELIRETEEHNARIARQETQKIIDKAACEL